MAIQLINIGEEPGDDSGDRLRDAFEKVEENFDELWSELSTDGSNLKVARVARTGSFNDLINRPNPLAGSSSGEGIIIGPPGPQGPAGPPGPPGPAGGPGLDLIDDNLITFFTSWSSSRINTLFTELDDLSDTIFRAPPDGGGGGGPVPDGTRILFPERPLGPPTYTLFESDEYGVPTGNSEVFIYPGQSFVTLTLQTTGHSEGDLVPFVILNSDPGTFPGGVQSGSFEIDSVGVGYFQLMVYGFGASPDPTYRVMDLTLNNKKASLRLYWFGE